MRCLRVTEELTQGSIIYGTRSNKYPGVRCYGIIISARCDIANCKIPKYFYLTAVEIREWLTTNIGFKTIYTEKVKTLEGRLKQFAKNEGLDWTVLSSRSEDEFMRIITDSSDMKSKEIKEWTQTYTEFMRFTADMMSSEDKTEEIRKDKKQVLDYLARISDGRVIHYCFIPQAAYETTNNKKDGMIVDLQEIEILPMEDASKIKLDMLDYACPKLTKEERECYNRRYFLETKDDFVCSEGVIQSPWIEYLMQQFSHAFIRIGVDLATKNDFTELIKKI